MVTIVITELIPHRFWNPYLLCFRKICTLCDLLLFLHEIQVNEMEVVKKVEILKKVTCREWIKLLSALL